MLYTCMATWNALIPSGVTLSSITVDGRKLHWIEAGHGQPTIVLEAGHNDVSLSWAPVVAQLVQHQVHVIAYDRAGLGMSDPCPGSAIVPRELDDLAAIIRHAAGGRCILVGHSWGGLLAQLLAFQHPELVCGLVLVDPGHEAMLEPLPAIVQRVVEALFPQRVRPVLHALGLLNALERRTARQRAQAFSSDPHVRDLVLRTYQSYAGHPDELHGAGPALLSQLRAAPQPFPDIPVMILSASQGFPRQVRVHWTGLQVGLAAQARYGTHVVVANVDHAIPQKRPDAVVDAILRCMAQGAEIG